MTNLNIDGKSKCSHLVHRNNQATADVTELEVQLRDAKAQFEKQSQYVGRLEKLLQDAQERLDVTDLQVQCLFVYTFKYITYVCFIMDISVISYITYLLITAYYSMVDVCTFTSSL